MKISIKLFSTVLLITLLFVGIVSGQSLKQRLQTMAAKNAELYVNPLVTAFGSGMNSGWFHSARPHKLLGFDVGVRAMAVTFPDDQKSFQVDLSDLTFSETFNLAGTDYNILLNPNDIYLDRTAPTFLGDKEIVDVAPRPQSEIDKMVTDQLKEQGIPDLVLNYSNTQDKISEFAKAFPTFSMSGIGLKALPLVVPQAAVGLSLPMLPIKAEIVVRGLPEVELSKDLGKFQFMGGGVKLALDPFIPIPMFPVNISVGAFTQQMTLGTVFEANNTLISLMAGKDISLLLFGVGVYGAVGMESSNIKINYEYMNDKNVDDPLNGTNIKFDLKGDNKFRTTVGGRIRLAIFNISADYSMGADNVLTAGVGLSIR